MAIEIWTKSITIKTFIKYDRKYIKSVENVNTGEEKIVNNLFSIIISSVAVQSKNKLSQQASDKLFCVNIQPVQHGTNKL